MIKKAAAALGIFLVLFCYTYEQVQILKIGYDITEKEKNLKDLNQKNMELLVKSSRLKSPNRIETISREQLGLVVSKPSKIVFLRIPKSEATSQAKAHVAPEGTQPRVQSLAIRLLPRFLEHWLLDAEKEVEAEIVIQ